MRLSGCWIVWTRRLLLVSLLRLSMILDNAEKLTPDSQSSAKYEQYAHLPACTCAVVAEARSRAAEGRFGGRIVSLRWYIPVPLILWLGLGMH
jgi:hypothetical protein